jgi:hypothetical protein
MSESRRTTAASALLLAAALVPAALLPIRSYDFFWHLATGRWIVEHHALPRFDPFAIASDRVPWINGEWLFEIALASIGSITAIAWVHAAAVALLFALVYFIASREAGRAMSLLLTALAFAGGVAMLDARPSTAAAGLLAIGVALLDSNDRRAGIAYVVVSAIWINIHPSALLAPLLALLGRRRWVPFASAAALLVNPFGWRGITAPLALVRFAQSGAFVNSEWLPSPATVFPLLYLCVVLGVAAFAMDRRHLRHFAVFALLAYLAIAHVRNQGLFFAAFPLLVAPMVSSLAVSVPKRTIAAGAIAASALLIAAVWLRFPHAAEIAAHRFPERAVDRLMQARLAGNIYNPDQLGGYLIWRTYPERRVLTDGRNELYHAFVPEYARARGDSRAWHALLAKYRIDLAVDEYRPLLDTVNPKSGEHTRVPASLAYWPRKEWALIAYDEVAMVFARRAAFPPDRIASLELKGVVPDALR